MLLFFLFLFFLHEQTYQDSMIELLTNRPIEQTQFMESHEIFKRNSRKQFSLNCFGDTTKYLEELEVSGFVFIHNIIKFS